MKKTFIFLLGVILIMGYVNLSANDYIYNEKEQKSYTMTLLQGELCNFRFVLENPYGVGWSSSNGIEITVDGVGYGLVRLPWGMGNYYAEEIIALPSGELQLYWIGNHSYETHQFKVYNSLDELIYTSPEDDFIYGGIFLTYQNECVECLPITDLEGIYIAEEHQVNLSWTAPESTDLIGYDIYRNDELIDHLPPSTVSYFDNTTELEDGYYTYCVSPIYPSICSLDEKCFGTYISNVGIVDYKDNILIYPNPTNNIVNISGIDVANVKIFNSIGQLVLNQHNTNAINVSALQNGIYILSVKTSTGSIIQKKISINH
ncbi:MAG: T9SS type A sorting domain-containing protein [Lentimicrobiaceae bacterium]|nr:T9SS type A sorting domain-containing protein [Lentimicrobiaceae bacterium]